MVGHREVEDAKVKNAPFCDRHNTISGENRKAFTLVELLVVISIVALLMAILMPALASARSGVRKIVCKSNIRQILLANIAYADENDGFYVPAAKDLWDDGGLHRWHGVRQAKGKPFEPEHGPLVAYLANGEVKKCPEKVNFVESDDWDTSFEQGGGGYGYNMAYIGSRTWQSADRASYERTTRATEVRSPAQTLMFADTAMSNDGKTYMEYSFAEPPHMVYAGKVMTSFYMSETIHFRHKGKANVGWVAGHVGQEKMADFDHTNVYGVDSAAMNLGWFDPVDNTLFDLK